MRCMGPWSGWVGGSSGALLSDWPPASPGAGGAAGEGGFWLCSMPQLKQENSYSAILFFLRFGGKEKEDWFHAKPQSRKESAPLLRRRQFRPVNRRQGQLRRSAP